MQMTQTTLMKKTTIATMTTMISRFHSPRPFFHASSSLSESGMYFHEARIGAKLTSYRRKPALKSPSKQVFECRDSHISASMLFYNHISKSNRLIYVRPFVLNIVLLYSCIILPRGPGIPRYQANSESAEAQ